MELLRSYDSDERSSEDCRSFQEALGEKEVRSVYLITYSQANLDLFPTREEFASAVVKSFAKCNANILQWSVLQLWKPQKIRNTLPSICEAWSQSTLAVVEGVFAQWVRDNRSSKHHNYYSAWTYVTKEDENFIESVGHPDLKNAGEPKTTAASRARRNNKRKRNAASENHDDGDDQDGDDDKDTDSRASRRSTSTRKRKRLTAF